MSYNTFPYDARKEQAYKGNPAIQLYGNRYSNDQTGIECLSEFLLIAISEKRIGDETSIKYFNTFLPPQDYLNDWDNEPLWYSPKARLNLKLFSFFGASRLDSRHRTHNEHYQTLVEELKKRIHNDDGNVDLMINTLEKLLLGFLGAGSRRTWCAQTFLPITKSFIAGETIWNETEASKKPPNFWYDIIEYPTYYFSMNKHRFLARGGELIYLQICNALRQDKDMIRHFSDSYGLDFTDEEIEPKRLSERLEKELSGLMNYCPKGFNDLVEFIDTGLDDETSSATDYNRGKPRFVQAGWCSDNTWQEGYMLAVELLRICRSKLDIIEKISFLESAFQLHIMRNLIMQSYRVISLNDNYLPVYYLALSSPDEQNAALKRISNQTLKMAEMNIFNAVRTRMYNVIADKPQDRILNEADRRSGHKLFIKTLKQSGLATPKKGSGTRLVLNPHLLRLLVITTVPVNGRLTYDTFKKLIKSRYRFIFDAEGFSEASKWVGGKSIYLGSETDQWVLRMLEESGLLMHLSDSCSLVKHPTA